MVVVVVVVNLVNIVYIAKCVKPKMKEEKKIECPICGIIIKNRKANLSRHSTLHKEKHDRKKCSICGKTFQTKGNLKIHLVNIHSIGAAELREQLNSLGTVSEEAKSIYFAIDRYIIFILFYSFSNYLLTKRAKNGIF